MSDRRRLIRNACVITMDPALGTLERADILIEGEQIRAVAPDIAAEDCEVIDGTDMIAIPGFVDAHRHVFTTPLRGLGADYTTFDYAAKIMIGIDPHIRAEGRSRKRPGLLHSLSSSSAWLRGGREWCLGRRTATCSAAPSPG